MQPLSWIIAGVVALAVAVGMAFIYQKGHSAGEAEIQLAWDNAVEDQRDRDRMASLTAAKGLQEERGKRRTIIEERTVYVDRNIEVLVHSGACFTPGGVQCLNGSIEGTGAAGCKPDGAVPAAVEAR